MKIYQKELDKLITYNRQEEKIRIGGINENLSIQNFSYFTLDFNNDLITAFDNMQNKYVLNKKYKIGIEQVKKILPQLHSKLKNW